MKTEVIRSGDKNFNQEKAKIFEPEKLTKEKQLEIAFKKILGNYVTEQPIYDIPIDDIVKELLTEVKIRAKL